MSPDFLQNLEPALEVYSVGGFIKTTNLLTERALGTVAVVGEVAEFKINQNKWVFFTLKETTEESAHRPRQKNREFALNCFLPKFKLNVPIANGMQIKAIGSAKVTDWGKFSFTVEAIQPQGEGSIKKSFELLKTQLADEGLFAPERKQSLPRKITRIGVVSSVNAAGYADFVKILNERWGGMQVLVANTQVQGLTAVPQIVEAITYLNADTDADVIALIRGGGSADDLAIWNDERIVRAIAASRIPVITGIGHETDESLADLAADVRASTPSNAAQILTPDKTVIIAQGRENLRMIRENLERICADAKVNATNLCQQIREAAVRELETARERARNRRELIEGFNPEKVLAQGYALIIGRLAQGEQIEIRTAETLATATVESVTQRPA